MAEPHVSAAADQEQAELRLTLRSLLSSAQGFQGTDDERLGTIYLSLRMFFPAYEDMSVAAAELVWMLLAAKQVTP